MTTGEEDDQAPLKDSNQVTRRVADRYGNYVFVVIWIKTWKLDIFLEKEPRNLTRLGYH